MTEKTVDEKIDALIHNLLDRAKTASARDAHSLSGAVKELYACRELARGDAERDWMTALMEGSDDDPDMDLSPDFGLSQNQNQNQKHNEDEKEDE